MCSSWLLYSLKHAILPNSSISSITWSSFATNSTSKEANAAKGSASENSRLVIAILLSCGLKNFRSPASFGRFSAALFVFHSSNAELSVFTLDKETPLDWSFRCFSACAAAMASMLVAWLLLEPRKSLGWEFMASLRSCKASWRWSESISGEQWQCFLVLSASSISTFDTSPASLMQGSLNRVLTDRGV